MEKSIKDTVFQFVEGAHRNLKNFKTIPKYSGKMNEPNPIYDSLGLSLAMAKVYANYWGGDIDSTTMDGFGTDFYVSLLVGNQIEQLRSESIRNHIELLK